MPTSVELLALAETAGKAELTAYEEKAVAASIMATAPVAGTIAGKRKLTELGVTELSLSNGVRVILKPTDFKNDQVVMNASRFGGQYLFDPKERFNAEFAATVVAQMGVGQFSPLDLRKVLAGKTATVAPRIGAITESTQRSVQRCRCRDHAPANLSVFYTAEERR